MQTQLFRIAALLWFLGIGLIWGQGAYLKPHYGYLFPKMSAVNNKIRADINIARQLLDPSIPAAGEIGGSPFFGGQIEYHLNEDYFFNISVEYFQDEVASRFQGGGSQAPWSFDYQREVKMYDIMFNIHYYFNYNSWQRFNKYLGVGVGVVVVDARSLTVSDHPNYLRNSRGDFSGSVLSGLFSLGGDFRIVEAFKLWAEVGYQVSSVGQLDGRITTLQNPERQDIISESSFDLTGPYVRGGIALAMPFLR